MLLKTFLVQLPLAWFGFLEPKIESQDTGFASVVYTDVSSLFRFLMYLQFRSGRNLSCPTCLFRNMAGFLHGRQKLPKRLCLFKPLQWLITTYLNSFSPASVWLS